MSESYKINHLKELSIKEVVSLLSTVLTKQGISDVSIIEDNCVTGLQISAFSSLKLLFVVFEERLGGRTEEEIKSLGEKISDLVKMHASSGIHLVSQATISKGFKSNLEKYCQGIQLVYIDRDELINHIDKVFPEYWRHDDAQLINYENEFLAMVEEDQILESLVSQRINTNRNSISSSNHN